MSLLLSKLQLGKSPEEKQVYNLLLSNEDVIIKEGDQRLHSIAALTYNKPVCDMIFHIIQKCLTPSDYPHYVLYKTLLLLKTVVLYGR